METWGKSDEESSMERDRKGYTLFSSRMKLVENKKSHHLD